MSTIHMIPKIEGTNHLEYSQNNEKPKKYPKSRLEFSY